MPDRDRRNPYFILGVDYGCSASEATAAFGRASRRLRKQTEEQAEYDVEDLTWALSQIEAIVAGHSDEVGQHFRVPADPHAYEVSPTAGILLLPAIPIGRETDQVPAEEVEQLRQTVLADAREQLVARGIAMSPGPGIGVNLASQVAVQSSAPSLDAEIRARHERASQALAVRIWESKDPQEIAAAASAVWSSRFGRTTEFLMALARNPSTPAEWLTEIAGLSNTETSILIALVHNRSCPNALLYKLARDHPGDVRQEVMRNQGVPKEVRTLVKRMGAR